MQKQHSEHGRSLIEIIAVLIIMAILLISALIGFKILLDYLKKKQTAEQIGTIGMRYKLDRMGKKSKGGAVSHKQWYPEGKPCNLDVPNCVTTPDGGQIRLYSYENTDTFVVVASQISPQSCAEAVLQESYTRVRRLQREEIPDGDDFLSNELGNIRRTDGQWTNNSYLSVQDFRDHPERIMDFCCLQENGKKCSFGFIYASGTDDEENCRYFCTDGKCHYCACDKAKDAENKCCEPKYLDKTQYPDNCGLCEGCGSDRTCVNGQCQQCADDEDCVNKHCTGVCVPGNRQYCIKGFCKPCRNVGDFCGSFGTGGNLFYCDSDLECPDPHCEPNCPPSVCYKCQSIDPRTNRCHDIYAKNLPLGATCDKNKKDANNNDCPDTCYGTKTECICSGAGNTDCTCQVKTNPDGMCIGPRIPENGDCSTGSVPNDNDCCATVTEGAQTIQLKCKNGKCARPDSCDALDEPDQAKRFFTKGCSEDCPCANDFLRCENGSCKCKFKPTKKGSDCWGECGCGVGLECQKTIGGVSKNLADLPEPTPDDLGKAQTGTCQCNAEDFELGMPCSGNNAEKDCLCSQRTVSNSDERPVLICYDDGYETAFKNTILENNPEAQKFTCQCNPKIDKYSLPAGSRCVEGCQQCGPDKNNPLPCFDGLCGCQTDADCADNCSGKTKCNTSTHVCTCDSEFFEEQNGQCVCKGPGNAHKVFWRIPENGRYICCEDNQLPYLIEGAYECRVICGQGEKAIKNLALLLDYSYSTLLNGYDAKIKTSAQAILTAARRINPDIKVGLYREDNSASGTNCTGEGQDCQGTKTDVEVQAFSNESPDLAQDACACNCGNGQTCFSGAIDKVKEKCVAKDTLAFLISDGVIPNDSATGMDCGIKNTYILAKEGENVDFGLGGYPHEMDFTAMNDESFLKVLKSIVEESMCVDSSEAKRIVSNWLCKSSDPTQ